MMDSISDVASGLLRNLSLDSMYWSLAVAILFLTSLGVFWFKIRPRSLQKPRVNFIDSTATSFLKRSHKKSLIVFVHGLLGSEESTWGNFPKLVIENPETAKKYDVATFGYPTGLFHIQKVPSLDELAGFLDTELETKCRSYGEIVLVAHSMGGLLARKFVANSLERETQPDGKPCRVSRMLFFATPHRGSMVATTAKFGFTVMRQISSIFGSLAEFAVQTATDGGASEQLKSLATGSDFIFDLERQEERVQARDRTYVKYVIAESDLAVDRNSGVGSLDFHVIHDSDHSSLVKPETADHASVQVARDFLKYTRDKVPYAANADHRQPVLNITRPGDKSAGDDPSKRFVFWNQEIPFVGRKKELKHLEAFLAPNKSTLRWLVLNGPGGIGKSRLALEICQVQSTHYWNAGFVDPSREMIDWRVWQPRIPTLMIVDYAGGKARHVATMLAGLSERSPGHEIRHPVRVILIERDGREDSNWLRTILRSSHLVDDTRTRHENLELEALDDSWPIFEAIEGADQLGREETLSTFAIIDPDCRPLHAFLMADAIARGEDVRLWDRLALLKNVIQREEQHFWFGPSASDHGTLTPATQAEKRALALATMTGSIARSVLNGQHGQLLPRWNIDRHPKLFAAMTGESVDERVTSVQPDIIGEFFVIEILKETKPDHNELIDIAWQNNPHEMSLFVSRLGQDFLSELATVEVLETKLDTSIKRKSWSCAAADLVGFYGESHDLHAARKIHDQLLDVAKAHAEEPELRFTLALASMTLIADYAAHSSTSDAQVIYDGLTRLSDNFPGDEILAFRRMQAAVNLISAYGNAGNLDQAHNIYSEMKLLSIMNSGMEGKRARVEFAKGSLNTLNAFLRKGEIQSARDIYDELKEFCDCYREETEIQARRSNAALRLLFAYSNEGTFDSANEIYAELSDLAKKLPQLLQLQQNWAVGTGTLISLASNLGTTDRIEMLNKELESFGHIAKAGIIFSQRAVGQSDNAEALLRQFSEGDEETHEWLSFLSTLNAIPPEKYAERWSFQSSMYRINQVMSEVLVGDGTRP